MAIWLNSKGKNYASTGPTAWLKRYVEQLIENLKVVFQIKINNIPVRNMGGQTIDIAEGESVTAEEGATVISDVREPVFDEAGKIEEGNVASGHHAIAMGLCTTATGSTSVAAGCKTEAVGDSAFAMGNAVEASGAQSVAMGSGSLAGATCAIAMGDSAAARGKAAVALGSHTEASGEQAVAIGGETTATGANSVAGGYQSSANGVCATAFGCHAVAEGENAVAMGDHVVSNAHAQMVHGAYNQPDASMLHIVGNGSEGARSNAYTLDENGNGWFAGGVTVGEDKEKLVTETRLAEKVNAVLVDDLVHTTGDEEIWGNKTFKEWQHFEKKIYVDNIESYNAELGISSGTIALDVGGGEGIVLGTTDWGEGKVFNLNVGEGIDLKTDNGNINLNTPNGNINLNGDINLNGESTNVISKGGMYFSAEGSEGDSRISFENYNGDIILYAESIGVTDMHSLNPSLSISSPEELNLEVPEGNINLNAPNGDVLINGVSTAKMINETSNAVKGSGSSRALYLDDVSPLEHKVKVTVNNASGEENAISDLGAVRVIRYGKNLCDREYIADRSNWTFLDNSYDSIPIYVGKGNTVTLSYAEKITTDVGFYAFVMTKNSTAGATSTRLVHRTNPSGNNQVVTLTAIEDYIYLRVSLNEMMANLVNFMEYIGNSLQIEIGTKATPYEEYIEPTYYPVVAEDNSVGTVEGVMSLSPSMTLMADTEGAVLEVEYNRDINKVIENLTNAIISLGGNV